MRSIGKLIAVRREGKTIALPRPSSDIDLPGSSSAGNRIRVKSGGRSRRAADEYPSRYGSFQASSYCQHLADQMEAWERERQKSSTIDIQSLMAAEKVSGSSFAAPWAVEIVEPGPLDALKLETEDYRDRLSELQRTSRKRLPVGLPGNPPIFGIGPLKAACGVNSFDGSPSDLTSKLIELRPGESEVTSVVRGPYDLRSCKYLFVIDHYGLHVLHELTACKTTARGFGGHPQLPKIDGWAAVGGEAFFSDEDYRTVYINFGSGRFPPTSTSQMDASARYWLACGMNAVVAVFSDRDLSRRAYGLTDRYGQQLANKLYLRKFPIKDALGRI